MGLISNKSFSIVTQVNIGLSKSAKNTPKGVYFVHLRKNLKRKKFYSHNLG